ncbi:MAG TPA: hypothetical protein VFW79_06395 [Cellulomonas sp.]|uniref:baeRF3 domain-containing protein n=1 Tax=Cellulomonas sp. TaxID=40001 RepID=UPI002E368FC7|nr:hypothetical protein [Cellulomonas sp.]HEX5332256.1 hypothetical protein [Cellulomonas sp.]
MDLFTTADLEALAAPGEQGTHVSLFMPTHRSGSELEADPLRWKNLVRGVASVLAARGERKPDIDELLAPAWELHADSSAWERMSDGLAVFLRPGWTRVYRVPVDVPEVAVVGDRFVVGPLVRVLASDGHFLVLTVSQRRMRLLEGTQHRLDEVALGDVPASLRDVIAPPERGGAEARPLGGGRSGTAVFYGGAGDDNAKKDDVRWFLKQVADGLHDYLSQQDLPMVLVGLEPLVGMFREVASYGHILDRDVRQNPDQLSAADLHDAAWPVVAERLSAVRQHAVDRFAELNGTGLASSDLDQIEEAATAGRVETLLLAANPWCWEQVGAAGPTVVELGRDPAIAPCERLDRAATGTLLRRGQVLTFTDPGVPGGGQVAAVFRY